MKTARVFLLATAIFISAFSSLIYAGVPQMINYQGKITTPAGALVDTTVQMIFTIYDDSTIGTALWADTQSTVVVEKGIFSVLLGSGNPIPDSVFPGDGRYLGVKVGTDPEMTPRKQIVSVAYAYKSEYADTAQYAQVAVSDGDWTPDTAGINIYRLTGKVGIGTPTPGSKLELNGDGALQFAINNSSGRNWGMRSDNTGKFSLWDFSALNEACIVTSSGAPDAFTFEFKGDVGIGTPSPGSKLEIKGDGALQLAINNTSGRNWVMRSDNTGKLSLWDYSALNDACIVTSAGAPDAFTFEFKGDVGIGTPSPAQKLHVAGNVQVDDTLFASNVSSNSPLRLQTAGTTRVYVDDGSGLVGIGTTNPAKLLDVAGSNPTLRITDNRSLSVWTQGDRVCGIEFYSSDESSPRVGCAIDYVANISQAYPRGALLFRTADTYSPGLSDKMIIGANGNVGIGTTAPTHSLDVSGDVRIRTLPAGAGAPVVVDALGGLWRGPSSIRYKKNIEALQVDPGRVFELKPVRFNWKTTEQGDIGLIAEDVDEVIPDLVIYDSDGKPDAVKYDKVAIYLLEVVKTQQKRISALEQQIAELKR